MWDRQDGFAAAARRGLQRGCAAALAAALALAVGVAPGRAQGQDRAATYFVSAAGSDASDGRTDSTAWRTLTRVAEAALAPGDAVLLRGGDVFVGTLKTASSGTAAAPILFDAFARSGKPATPLPHAPRGTIFAATGKLPPPLQRYRPHGMLGEGAAPPRIMFPPDGARIELAGGTPDPLALKISGGVQPLTVLINGVPLANHSGQRTVFFQPEGAGFMRLTVMDARGAADSVMVRVQ